MARTPHARHDDQAQREKAQRDIALGRRVESLVEGENKRGHTGTVVKRWVNASVVPIAARLRSVAGAFLDGDTHQITQLLDSPLFGLAEFEGDGHQDLGPVMRWLLKGGSPGRVKRGDTNTYAEDLVLAANELLGGITLDVASSKVANEYIEAENYYTPTDDGLNAQQWYGCCYLFPPSGAYLCDQKH